MTAHIEEAVDLQLARNVEHDPFEALARYRDRDPFWSESGDFYQGGFWVVGRYEQCREVLQDADLFPTEVFGTAPLLPTMAGPPQLQKLRSVLLPHLARSKVVALESSIAHLAGSYIDSFAGAGSCDFVAEFAQLYPIAVFSELFGLQADKRSSFRQLAEEYLHSYADERDAAWDAIRTIVRGELEVRRSQPRDDLLTGIATGRIDGELIDMDVCVNLASTVFLGGLDTLPSNLGWAFRYLARNPEARQRITAEPGLVPAMVEEFLRYYPVVAKERRLVAKDHHFHGVDFKAGDRVVALMSLANRDTREFEHGHTVNFDRSVNRHMAFGAGPHRCLGSHLARHELAIALTEWHRRIPDYEIDDSVEMRFHGGIIAVANLPLKWDPTSIVRRDFQ